MTDSETYHLFGQSGLRVSQLALGTMTFGNTKWGADDAMSGRILRRYLEAGGNFIDTADTYADGRSETLLGELLAGGLRDEVVLATKFSNPTGRAVNARGNARKHIIEALEASLLRLKTDYVDVYWLHVWDGLTPAEEVLRTLDDLVRAGKIRAIGLSNVPAWYAAKVQTLAHERGLEPIAALQLEYSLIERSIEWEHVSACRDLGMDVMPWSPLANGFLTGKYSRDGSSASAAGRIDSFKAAGYPTRTFSEQDWMVLETLTAIAKRIGQTPAKVALNWVARRQAVTTTLIGARSVCQLDENLKALEFTLTAEDEAQLEAAGRRTPPYPHSNFAWLKARSGPRVRAKPETYYAAQ